MTEHDWERNQLEEDTEGKGVIRFWEKGPYRIAVEAVEKDSYYGNHTVTQYQVTVCDREKHSEESQWAYQYIPGVNLLPPRGYPEIGNRDTAIEAAKHYMDQNPDPGQTTFADHEG